jgi:hypothetical protein
MFGEKERRNSIGAAELLSIPPKREHLGSDLGIFKQKIFFFSAAPATPLTGVDHHRPQPPPPFRPRPDPNAQPKEKITRGSGGGKKNNAAVGCGHAADNNADLT